MKTKNLSGVMNLTLFVLIFLLVGIISCNKNQKAVKNLDGSWNADTYMFNGESYFDHESDEIVLTFNNCKLKKEESCTGSWDETNDNESKTYEYTFKVINDGNDIELEYNLNGFNFKENYRIETISSKSLKLAGTNEEMGQNFTLTKQ